MMATNSLIILCSSIVCVVLFTSQVNGQNCVEPTLADISSAANSAIRKIAQRKFLLDPTGITVDILNFTISCLSVGTIRDRYRFASVVTYLTTTSSLLESDGCPNNTICLSYFEASCNDVTNTWEDNDLYAVESFTIDGNSTIFLTTVKTPRIDCGSCGFEGAVSPIAMPVFDPVTHCFLCDPVCNDEGLDRCFGLTTVSCCNFYQNNTCVSECSGDRRLASAATNFTCVCNNSFQEPDCSNCSLTCVNGTLDSENCYCQCNVGFTGERCDININECLKVNCGNGTCEDGINSFMCNCYQDYQGTFCDSEINQCEGGPCLNGGLCTDGNNTFICNCSPGYTGDTCINIIDNCNTNPCVNGQCINAINNFTCNCSDNFSGRFCNVCSIANCEICSTTSLGICNVCKNPYYTLGGQCLPICDALSPCENGGTCSNTTNGSYTCQCPFGYTGINCTLINLCESSMPCQNGGTCNSNYNDGSYTCQCSPGYTGTNCTTNICDSMECKNGGTCQLGTCQCLPDFNGTMCEDCQLQNCTNCSLIGSNDVVCSACVSGYELQNGSCIPSSSCDFQPDSQLCKWKEVATTCQFPVATCTDKEHTSYSEYRNSFNCYKKLQKEWKRKAKSSLGATGTSIDTTEVQGLTNKREKLVKEWRKLFSDVIENLMDWVTYYKGLYPNANIPPVPTLDIDAGNPDDLYNQYIAYWSNILQQFKTEAVPTQCT